MKKKKGVKKENTTKKSDSKIHLKFLRNHNRSFAQKASDSLSKWVGSWAFILSFFVFLGLWMSANVYMWVQRWDPYPFILLNLVLSCLAAVQAPIILMSQNRAAQRDRIKAENDYHVNRKAEKEIQEIKRLLQRKLK
jgi:uncharacterized membrane protein